MWQDSLVEQSCQGQFTQEGHQDILATTIGRPEHPRRVCATGTGIGIRQFFGSSSHPSSYGLTKEYEEKIKEDIRKKMTQEITKKVRVELYDEAVEIVAHQFQQRYEDYDNHPPPSLIPEHVVAPTSRSDKGSCSAAGAPRDDMHDTRPCQLYIISPTGTMLVACGTVYETTTVVHGVELAKDEVKVTVDEVFVPDALVHLPTEEFFTVQEEFKSFVAWPRHLVGDVSDPPASLTSKKTHLSENDRLGALDELGNIISDMPMIVPWDSTTFGRETQISLYLHQQNVRELALGREEINITLIQLWVMYMFVVSNKMGFNDVYRFIDPYMTHERNKFNDIQAYITACFAIGKNIYFLPHILGSVSAVGNVVETDLFLKKNRGIRLSCDHNRGRKPSFGIG
ncbi:hypothetical protein LR48_Vigan07g204600 [Vigna angularis]|uniref:DUF8039 domain-containing protein n=1 Tax=Phaseolus angularis TaxID=3914 RepID=A0A0L9V0E4_PHAAN|nr:hypothetical protein LR48_Vigan07g204600 [Vigna angularis]